MSLRLWLLATTGFASLPALAVDDPGTPGSYAFAHLDYELAEFQPAGLTGPSEVTARVHYPTNLAAGPFPIVIAMHGAFAQCYLGDSITQGVAYPCNGPSLPFPSHIGYDYLGEALASHGILFVSVAANATLPFSPSFPGQMQARAEVIQHHLGLWDAWSSVGGAPFSNPNLFLGAVDLDRVGTLGHSRGGEGVMRHVLWNADQPEPYGLRAVMALAPTDFTALSFEFIPINNFALANVAFGVVLPYCDGDVNSLPGVHYFDNARYYPGGNTATQHVIVAMGANHNFFNTTWTPDGPEIPPLPGGVDDAIVAFPDAPHCGIAAPERLSASEQRAFATTYALAFFRRYLADETRFEAILTGHLPPPPSAQTEDLFFSFHAPAATRLDVNRLLALPLDGGGEPLSLSVNDLGYPATQQGLDPYELCGFVLLPRKWCLFTDFNTPEPHSNSMTSGNPLPGLSQLDLRWQDPGGGSPAFYRNALPAGTDVRDYYMLQFRAGLNLLESPAQTAQDFTVRLTDGAGATSAQAVTEHSNALFYPPGFEGAPVVPHNTSYAPHALLHTIHIPVTAFSGIDLSDVRSVDFVFDRPNANGDIEGAILIADIAFARLPGVADTDADGVIDTEDRCTGIANPSQCDTDGDGIGNHCDGDFNGDALTNGADATIFYAAYASGSDSGNGTDMNCDGEVNAADFDAHFIPSYLAGASGVSGLHCAGTTPCP